MESHTWSAVNGVADMVVKKKDFFKSESLAYTQIFNQEPLQAEVIHSCAKRDARISDDCE